MRIATILPLEEYWTMIRKGIAANHTKEQIREDLVTAMRGEMIQQTLIRTGYENVNDIPSTGKAEQISKSIIDQTQKKWNSLVKRCAKYKETQDMITQEDLLTLEKDRQPSA